MNSNYNTEIQDELLKVKLLHQNVLGIEQVWQKFETYLANQKTSFKDPHKKRFAFNIPTHFLLKGIFAFIIILPSLIFYNTINAKLPLAIYGSSLATTITTEVSKTNSKVSNHRVVRSVLGETPNAKPVKNKIILVQDSVSTNNIAETKSKLKNQEEIKLVPKNHSISLKSENDSCSSKLETTGESANLQIDLQLPHSLEKAEL